VSAMRSTRLLVLALMLYSSAARAQSQAVTNYAVRWAAYYARADGVPLELVEAIIETESGWQPYAVSSKGAVGLMQLMPETAYDFGVRNRFVLSENIRGGVEYLAWLMRLFHGDLRLVVAGYYAGAGPIEARQLVYSSREAYEYVCRVAAIYRRIRLREVSDEVPGKHLVVLRARGRSPDHQAAGRVETRRRQGHGG
jgi:soluble lytic murein transglycosylase-like protein